MHVSAIYLQFALLHKCFDTLLFSSAPSACGFWSPSLIFHEYMEIIYYLSPVSPLFLLIYSMPLPVARRDVTVLTGRGCGMVVGLFSFSTRGLDLLPKKHSPSLSLSGFRMRKFQGGEKLLMYILILKMFQHI